MPQQTIEEIIARLEGIIDDALRGQRRIGYFAPHLEERLFGFGMGAARDLAWLFAEQLVAAGAGNREHLIAKRDAETAIVGQTLYPLRGFAARVARWITPPSARRFVRTFRSLPSEAVFSFQSRRTR